MWRFTDIWHGIHKIQCHYSILQLIQSICIWEMWMLNNQYIVKFFGSKSGHLSNRMIERFFFIFSKLYAVFDDFSKWRMPNELLHNSEKHQILQKLQVNEENLAIFTVILMAAFGTKNVHSAMFKTLNFIVVS